MLIDQAVLTRSFFLMASSFSVAAVNSAFAWANVHFGSTSQYTLKKTCNIGTLDNKLVSLHYKNYKCLLMKDFQITLIVSHYIYLLKNHPSRK